MRRDTDHGVMNTLLQNETYHTRLLFRPPIVLHVLPDCDPKVKHVDNAIPIKIWCDIAYNSQTVNISARAQVLGLTNSAVKNH